MDSLQTALDSLQTSSATVDSIASPSSQYSFECVDMGVASNCFGEINPNFTGIPSDSYTYTLSNSCSTTWTEDYVSPTWRKFCISGLDPSLTEISFGFKHWYSSNSSGGTERQLVALGHDADVNDGVACFYTYKSVTGMIYADGLFEEGVPQWNVYSYSTNSNGWSHREHFDLLIEKGDGFYLDTGVRFDN